MASGSLSFYTTVAWRIVFYIFKLPEGEKNIQRICDVLKILRALYLYGCKVLWAPGHGATRARHREAHSEVSLQTVVVKVRSQGLTPGLRCGQARNFRTGPLVLRSVFS